MDYVACYNCEENFKCPDANRRDGCEWGMPTNTEDECNNCERRNEEPCHKEV